MGWPSALAFRLDGAPSTFVVASGAFEYAELASTPKEIERLMTFVVVGAGPTGVEMAGQIAELAHRTLKRDFRRIDPSRARIILLDAAPQVLPAFGEDLGAKATRKLQQLGVEVQLGAKVVDVDATGIEVEDPTGQRRRIEAVTKVWAAGVQASELGQMLAEHPEIELVLLDLSMPGTRGFSALLHVRGEYPELPVVIISSNDHPRVIRRAQQFGAAGFIPKSAPADAMGEAIEAVLEGGSWFPPMAAERSEADAELAAKLAQLTPQQFRVLLCLADGLLNKQIAATLGLAENTVKVHVTAILKKLGCYRRTQAAVLVKGLEAEGVEPD